MAAKDVYSAIDELATTLGTAASHREKMEQEIGRLESELSAIDTMLDAAADRSEYDEITRARKEAELDLRFARNRLNRFNMSPRIDHETLDDLMAQLGAEVDSAAKSYRQSVERPLSEIVTAGDEFDRAIGAVREAVRKLASVDGPVIERDATLRHLFSRFELGRIRSRAYADGTIVYPGLRDALRLAATAKQETFDTH